jgi:hypothetical protein
MEITEVSGQKAVPVIVQRVESSDFKGITKKQFFFRWDQLKGEADIYKLTFEDSPVILGLIALIDVPSEYRIEIKLLTVSKENRGSGKQYEGDCRMPDSLCREGSSGEIQKVCLCFLKAENGNKTALHQQIWHETRWRADIFGRPRIKRFD